MAQSTTFRAVAWRCPEQPNAQVAVGMCPLREHVHEDELPGLEGAFAALAGPGEILVSRSRHVPWHAPPILLVSKHICTPCFRGPMGGIGLGCNGQPAVVYRSDIVSERTVDPTVLVEARLATRGVLRRSDRPKGKQKEKARDEAPTYYCLCEQVWVLLRSEWGAECMAF